jgi:hypothetical protein
MTDVLVPCSFPTPNSSKFAPEGSPLPQTSRRLMNTPRTWRFLARRSRTTNRQHAPSCVLSTAEQAEFNHGEYASATRSDHRAPP